MRQKVLQTWARLVDDGVLPLSQWNLLLGEGAPPAAAAAACWLLLAAAAGCCCWMHVPRQQAATLQAAAALPSLPQTTAGRLDACCHHCCRTCTCGWPHNQRNRTHATAIDRLGDESTLVVKAALQLLHKLVSCAPFRPPLNAATYANTLAQVTTG